MRIALLVALLAGGTAAGLSLPRALTNADFIYMCASAALMADGGMPASPYFPPGYPALLWLCTLAGLQALHAGLWLSALGTALTGGAVAYCARLWRIPDLPALLLGLLAVSLPSVFMLALNPHLDALYTGLGAVMLAGAMRALHQRPGAGVYLALLPAAVVLLSLRYHAALLVIPLALVLAFTSHPGVRLLGVGLLATTVLTLVGLFAMLLSVTGSYATAASVQVSAGATYRTAESADEAEAEIFDDYASWLWQRPDAGLLTILDGIRANWPLFLTRKAILAGLAIWLLVLAIRRRAQPGSGWLALFVLGYTLAVSPTYFTARASALPEIAGVLLAIAGISALLVRTTLRIERTPKQRGFEMADAARGVPVGFAALIAILALAGLGYNAWRELPILDAQRELHLRVALPNRELLELAGDRRRIYGRMDFTAAHGVLPFNLPGASWSRLWMDDPEVAPRLDSYLPKYDPAAVAAGHSDAEWIILWPEHSGPIERDLMDLVQRDGGWREVKLASAASLNSPPQVWQRRED